ncbi:MAG: hypothetical protein ACLQFR_30490 [Streptosporangiaceae bacterium]
MNDHTRDVPAELARLLSQVAPHGGGFGHYQHVHLAFLAAREHGTAAAVQKISAWIRHLAAQEKVPQKYHATMTRAWTEIVGHHAEADLSAGQTGDFADFASRHPALLDKRLLSVHYSAAALARPAARTGWVEPDLAPFPWS